MNIAINPKIKTFTYKVYKTIKFFLFCFLATSTLLYYNIINFNFDADSNGTILTVSINTSFYHYEKIIFIN